MNSTETFCRQVRARSEEHRRAMNLLYGERLLTPAMAILRQELDSMVRVIYLLSLTDLNYRDQLIAASVEGRQWTLKGSNKRLTDREMVDLAQQLQGWTASVYRFGCAFIHLSNFHDYNERDPLSALDTGERDAILDHIENYHGRPPQTNPTLTDLAPYLPRVFDKVASNLEYYVQSLESQAIKAADDI